MDTRFKLLTGAFAATSVLLTACGASSSGSNSSFADQTYTARSNQIAGPLDPVQDLVVGDVVGGQLAANLPEPVGPAVSCIADALNSLIDAPDALLAALNDQPNGADPLAPLLGAAADITGSLQRFASELQAGLSVLAGTESDCSTVASGGSAFNFGASKSNPLAGTPLAALGDALGQLGAGIPSTGGGDDPQLKPVTETLQSLIGQVVAGFSLVPAEVRSAPVVGGLLGTIETTLIDLDDTLPAVGNYDALQTQNGVEGLLNNLLSNVLLEVIPVSQIDDATGQDFSGQIQAGIDQATSMLGEGLGQLITPLFDDALNGALSPVMDPVEGLLAQILGQLPTGGQNPLTGLLAGAVNGQANPLDALLGLLTFGSTGNPLSDLTDALGGNSGQSPLGQLTDLSGGGLPLDQLLSQLQNTTAGLPLIGDLVEALLGEDGLLGGLLGGLAQG